MKCQEINISQTKIMSFQALYNGQNEHIPQCTVDLYQNVRNDFLLNVYLPNSWNVGENVSFISPDQNHFACK